MHNEYTLAYFVLDVYSYAYIFASMDSEMRKMAKWARGKVKTALLRGDLARQPCEVCGIGPLEFGCRVIVHAHHDDYSKPLDVRWLCGSHHKQHHVNNPAPPDHRPNERGVALAAIAERLTGD